MKQFLSKIAFFLIVSVCLILIALFPRETEVTAKGKALTVDVIYEFSWKDYGENIQTFFKGLVKDKSLGETRYNNPVEEEIAVYLPRSLKIIITAFILSIILGVLKGIFDFKNTGKRTNILGNGTTWLLQSVPDFFLILLLQWIIIFNIKGLDIFGHENWYSFIVPSLLVAIYPIMYISRITATSVAGEAGQQYIQVAKAKGLKSDVVIYKHVLKNCASTILNNVPTMLIYILSNLLFVEYLLDYKGAAYRLFVAFDFKRTIILNHKSLFEPSVIIGFGICFMAIVLVVQIASQLLRTRIDPR